MLNRKDGCLEDLGRMAVTSWNLALEHKFRSSSTNLHLHILARYKKKLDSFGVTSEAPNLTNHDQYEFENRSNTFLEGKLILCLI